MIWGGMPTQVFLLKIRVELQLQFLNRKLQKMSRKNFNRKSLHDYILFKSCAWLQQFYISIESFQWNMFYKKYF